MAIALNFLKTQVATLPNLSQGAIAENLISTF